MSSIVTCDLLSEKAREVFKEMESSCSSEALCIVDCLNTIAENGIESASDEFLVVCSKEIRRWADHFISRMKRI
jgi:hypothetical protein